MGYRSKKFEGNVSIHKGIKNQGTSAQPNKVEVIYLKRDPEGKYNAGNVQELLATMQEFSNKLKLPICRWCFYKAPEGTAPVLVWAKFQPAVWILPSKEPSNAPSASSKLA